MWLDETNQMNQINQIGWINQIHEMGLFVYGLLLAGISLRG